MDVKKNPISTDVIFYISFGSTLIGIGIGTYLHHNILDVLAPLAVATATSMFLYGFRFHESNKKLLNERNRLTKNLDVEKAKTIRYKSFAEAVVQGQEQEKKRLALELHDDTIQRLIIIGQNVQLLNLDANSAHLTPDLHKVETLVNDSIQSIRMFIKQLRPTYLEKLGLIPTLRELINQITENIENPISIELETEGTPCRINGDVELSLYRIAQSATGNILKHSHADKAILRLIFNEDFIELNIEDNGAGFHVPDDLSLLKKANFGLMGMQERADLLGAEFSVQTAPGGGTKISVKVPIDKKIDLEKTSAHHPLAQLTR
jgi:signal transduction histidine kinase